MKIDRLLHAEKQWLHLLVATGESAADVLAALGKSSRGKAVCRVIRGHKATTTADLFDEMSAALQFPSYFGENWDALDECLADLEWLPGDAYTIVFVQSEHLLEKEPPAQFQQMISVLAAAAATWSKPAEGQPARPAIPFHVVFQCPKTEEKKVGDRLRAANATFDLLE